MKKQARAAALWCTVFAAALLFLNALFMPKYISEVPEGALIAEYYQEKAPHDVVFIGDCEVYENFSPDVLWREYGIPSCIRGSAQQLIWQSYYLLKETLRYETPRTVVFNVLSMQYAEPQNEAYNRLNLDGMRFSREKLDAVRASMTPEESFLSYLFPFLRYHDRWQDLKAEDFTALFHRDLVSDSGYLMNVQVRPAGEIPAARPLPDYDFAPVCWDYLNRMADLCASHGVQLVLIKAPSLYPAWYDEWEAQIESFAETHGLPYINFLEMADTVGINYAEDTYDGGLHLNLYGAEKMSHWFGAWLMENTTAQDRRGTEPFESVWAEKSAAYATRKARLEAEWGT